MWRHAWFISLSCRLYRHCCLLTDSFRCSQLWLLRLCISAQCCCEGKFRGRVPGGEDSPSWSILCRASFYLSADGFLFGMSAATIIRGVRFLPFLSVYSCSIGEMSVCSSFQGNSYVGGIPRITYSQGAACNLSRYDRISDSHSIMPIQLEFCKLQP